MTNKLSRAGLILGLINLGSLIDIGFQTWNEIFMLVGFTIYVFGDDIEQVFF